MEDTLNITDNMLSPQKKDDLSQREEVAQPQTQNDHNIDNFYSEYYSVLKDDVSSPIDTKIRSVHNKYKLHVAQLFEQYKKKMLKIKQKQDESILEIKNKIEKDSTNETIIQDQEQKEFLNYLLYGQRGNFQNLSKKERRRIVDHFEPYCNQLNRRQELFKGKFELILTEYQEAINKLKMEYSLAVSTQTNIKMRKLSFAKTKIVELLVENNATDEEKKQTMETLKLKK